MWKPVINITIAFTMISISAFAQPTQPPRFADAAGLHASQTCLFSLVRERLSVQKPSPLSPLLKLESETSLAEFQEAMESFWKFRPDVYVNVYDLTRNTIFLTNAMVNYKPPRQPMESLVHELVHFVQVNDLNGGSGDPDLLEIEAIQIQEWFREKLSAHVVNGQYQGPCTAL